MVTVLATGGAGQVYARTTNPKVATGDGVAMAYRAGAAIRDLEFVQFHPTGLAVPGQQTVLLITEALRGEGAYLRNTAGERFMIAYDSRAELAARDVVVRGMVAEMRQEGADHVYLDATHLDPAWLQERFPTVTAGLREHGLDLATQLIPVAPVCHYFIGGVITDVWGRTTVPGLYASGEVASTGVHGANRLASNSLLEGLVFSDRVVRDLDRYIGRLGEDVRRLSFDFPEAGPVGERSDTAGARTRLTDVMQRQVGVLRREADLTAALASSASSRRSCASTRRARPSTSCSTCSLWARRSPSARCCARSRVACTCATTSRRSTMRSGAGTSRCGCRPATGRPAVEPGRSRMSERSYRLAARTAARRALREDLAGYGDLTGSVFGGDGAAGVVAREAGVLSGMAALDETARSSIRRSPWTSSFKTASASPPARRSPGYAVLWRPSSPSSAPRSTSSAV